MSPSNQEVRNLLQVLAGINESYIVLTSSINPVLADDNPQPDGQCQANLVSSRAPAHSLHSRQLDGELFKILRLEGVDVESLGTSGVQTR